METLLDCNGSVCITNDGELDSDFVLTVSNHIIQPSGVACNLHAAHNLECSQCIMMQNVTDIAAHDS